MLLERFVVKTQTLRKQLLRAPCLSHYLQGLYIQTVVVWGSNKCKWRFSFRKPKHLKCGKIWTPGGHWHPGRGLWPNRKVSYNYHHLNPHSKYTLPETNSHFAPEHRPKRPSSGNAPFFFARIPFEKVSVFPRCSFQGGWGTPLEIQGTWIVLVVAIHGMWSYQFPVERANGGSVAFPQQTMEICTYWLTQKKGESQEHGIMKIMKYDTNPEPSSTM